MELKLVDKGKNFLKIEISEADDTLLYPLISELLKDKNISEARYVTGHPQLDKPVIFVKVKKGRPQTALKKAAETLSDQFRQCRELLKKAAK